MDYKILTVNGRSKPATTPDRFEDLPAVWKAFGLPGSVPVIVIVGGAGGMTPDDIARLQEFFENHLVPLIEKKNAVVMTGGTDAGIMAAIGRARGNTRNTFPLVGVIARNVEGILSMLEPNHTNYILCPGNDWGDESEWIAAAARSMAQNKPVSAILINGGKITWNDASFNVKHGNQVLVAEGTGRTADVIAQTGRLQIVNADASELLRTGKVHIANFFKDPEGFIQKLDGMVS